MEFGVWRADIAEAAEGPEGGFGTGCVRAVDKPEMGSALLDGQRLRVIGFFLVAHPESAGVVGVAPLS